MSDVRTFTRSFAGGVITPELFGRLDLVKFQTGLALCRNFRVLPHGPAQNREGTEFIIETKDSTKQSRVVPFVLSDTVSYILELGDQYVRFHTNGGTVVEPVKNITSVTQANPGVVTSAAHGYSNGQWVFIDTIGGMTQLNGRFYKVAGAAANTFTLQDMAGADINTIGYSAYTSGGTAARVYEITSPYLEANIFDLHYAQATVKLSLVHQSYAPRELVITAPTNWALNTISFATPLANPTAVTLSTPVNAGVGATSLKYYYLVTSLDDNGNESTGASGGPAQNNLFTAGNRNRIQWTIAAGATAYNVYRSQLDSGFAAAASMWAFVGKSQSAEFVDDNIAADTSIVPPLDQTIFASTSNYPAAVGYFEQRRVFAGTATDPQTTWLTKSGTDANMAKSTPLRDDDPIKFRAISRETYTLKHVVPLDDLLLFSGAAVWRVFSDNSDALTPANVTPRNIAYTGASMVQPAVTAADVLFEEVGSGHMIAVKDAPGSRSGYVLEDVSLMATHLFDGHTLRDLSFASGRTKTCWAVRSDGVLVGMTYVPVQEVMAWHHHDTDGTFESCATVKEGVFDATYFVVKRTINGRQVRYIERLRPRNATVLVDAFHVDAGRTYSGAPTTTISNAWHLEGKVINVLADGIVHPQRTVTGGQFTLDFAASKIHFGIPITAQLQTLPLSYQIGGYKNVADVALRVAYSAGFSAGPSFTQLRAFKQRTTETYGSPTALFTGTAPVKLDGRWTLEGQVCVQQTDPLPLTVTALSLGASSGD